eukprot:CAMPEP_0182528662 /NCGR_PEP_ID=MMETSP1323-20130603/4658_1 /TAXON_ID=236787 /ORGANISM="Florenciella parvula, Strain RCC1693" /LENGTH=156 /DNA_ID=CAMNT_0024737803 /DNA_START=37 /DNA_END=509 /DNA_ORIENTATION=+
MKPLRREISLPRCSCLIGVMGHCFKVVLGTALTRFVVHGLVQRPKGAAREQVGAFGDVVLERVLERPSQHPGSSKDRSATSSTSSSLSNAAFISACITADGMSSKSMGPPPPHSKNASSNSLVSCGPSSFTGGMICIPPNGLSGVCACVEGVRDGE